MKNFLLIFFCLCVSTICVAQIGTNCTTFNNSVTITPNKSICSGTSTVLTATGGSSYKWSTNATTASITVSPAFTSTYKVTITNNSNVGTCSTVRAVTISLPSISSSRGAICQGQSATLTASGGTSYLWNTGTPANTASITVTPAVTTTYTVRITNASCVKILTTTVVVNPAPTLTKFLSSSVCPSTNTTTNIIPFCSATNLKWSTGATTPSITVSQPNIYTVIATGTNGCTSVFSCNVPLSPSCTIDCAKVKPDFNFVFDDKLIINGISTIDDYRKEYYIDVTNMDTGVSYSGQYQGSPGYINLATLFGFTPTPCTNYRVELSIENTDCNLGFLTVTKDIYLLDNVNFSCRPANPTVSTENTPSKSTLTISPNPTTGALSIQHTEDTKSIAVYDMLGKQILSATTDGGKQTDIDISAFPAGIYLLSADGQTPQKIVKQ